MKLHAPIFTLLFFASLSVLVESSKADSDQYLDYMKGFLGFGASVAAIYAAYFQPPSSSTTSFKMTADARYDGAVAACSLPQLHHHVQYTVFAGFRYAEVLPTLV
ncbi:uncharacterized protein LOC125046525 [Penaeus chinensis]|uniref:uncharacterized protein LOC125046525 n=1 Tax=Penaeus chinensis TaxID=139456 RepID=UPI001FB6F7D5|nr:uncharacterized protein LOC125046525 [Penaeus chinensis]